MADDKSWFLRFFYNIGQCEGFAATCDAKQCLFFVATIKTAH